MARIEECAGAGRLVLLIELELALINRLRFDKARARRIQRERHRIRKLLLRRHDRLDLGPGHERPIETLIADMAEWPALLRHCRAGPPGQSGCRESDRCE